MCLSSNNPMTKRGRYPGAPLLAVERRDLAIDPVPIDLASEHNQFVLHVDDLVQPRPEQIVRSRRLVLFRPHRPSDAPQNHGPQRKGILKTKLQGLAFSSSQSLQSQIPPRQKNRLPLNRLEACSRTTRYEHNESGLLQPTDVKVVFAKVCVGHKLP